MTSYTPSTDPTNPIDPARFAAALESLPLDALHAKAAEIRNSISHLRHSNEQMLPFADEGDQDCKDAMFENLTVIGRMNARLGLLKDEVEKRGMMWVDDPDDLRRAPAGDGEAVMNGTANGDHATSGAVGDDGPPAPRVPSGRLTDEELRRQMEAQMASDVEDEDVGVHL
jgi:hypothetical protein